jgi:hypothetical protein
MPSWGLLYFNPDKAKPSMRRGRKTAGFVTRWPSCRKKNFDKSGSVLASSKGTHYGRKEACIFSVYRSDYSFRYRKLREWRIKQTHLEWEKGVEVLFGLQYKSTLHFKNCFKTFSSDLI